MTANIFLYIIGTYFIFKDETEEESIQGHHDITDENNSQKENLVCIPYRPSSATQTHYLAIPASKVQYL